MNKKRMVMVSLTILIIAALVYWYWFSSPESLPSDEQLIAEMNDFYQEANVKTIQETIMLDDEHAYIPFISKQNVYGASYWKWERRKWRPIRISTSGDPIVWELEPDDPSTYHIVWNMNPKQPLSYASFYLTRDRNYHISGEKHRYWPQVQLKNDVNIAETSYGAMKLPVAWSSLLTQMKNTVSEPNEFNIFHSMGVQFAWIPYNEEGDQIFPENINGSTFSNGGMETQFVVLIDESELE